MAKANGAEKPSTSTKTDGTTVEGARRNGRPPKYNQSIHPQLAEAWAASGKTDKQISEKLGVSESTLNAWKTTHPEFSESIKRGKEAPDDQVEASLFSRAIGYNNPNAVKIFMPANAEAPVYAPYTEHYAPDVTAQIFWLKNRRPERWREKSEVEFLGPISIGLPPKPEGAPDA
jgi:hypothetical protein